MTHALWPYFTLRSDGVLVSDDQIPLEQIYNLPWVPRFASAAEAEAWLVANDIRGDVR